MEETKSIKETKELFKALGVLAKAAGEALEDGKLDFKDAFKLAKIDFNALKDGFSDMKEIPEELKDLSKEELLELMGLLYDAAKAY